jgi:hypothetical protein
MPEQEVLISAESAKWPKTLSRVPKGIRTCSFVAQMSPERSDFGDTDMRPSTAFFALRWLT